MIKYIYISTMIITWFCFACSDSKNEIKKGLIGSTNADRYLIYANKARKLGLEGVHIFNEAISSNIQNQDSLANYSKLMISLKYLRGMAEEGIYSIDSIPILLEVIENQRSIADSLITAEIIKIITGIDVGYDFDFVNSYTPSHEPMRKDMILKWRSLVSERRRLIDTSHISDR
jgi:hypothetical protein